jgi:glutamate-1-semialdehyde 2,1-aminomutase
VGGYAKTGATPPPVAESQVAESTVADRARMVIPGGVNSGQRCVPGIEDLVVASTAGATFTDTTGRTFVDYHAAFGPPLLGHNDPDVNAAVTTALHHLDLCGVGVTEQEVELAETVVDLVPSIEKLLLTSTGSEATFHALRLARAVTGRRYVVKFQGCYHGWHDAVSLNVISAPDAVGGRDPISAGILPEVLEATLVAEFNDVAGLTALFDELGPDIAAVILEPIPHNVGALLPDHEFLQACRDLTARHGAVLVFDEVITGFRHHLGGYQSLSGITPDLTTLGKSMANGLPIAALGGRADLMDQLSSRPGAPVFAAGTYNGHPAMVGGALATIRKLRDEPVLDHVHGLGDRVRAGLREVCADLGVPAVVTGYGSVFVTYFLDTPPRTYRDLLANDTDLFIGYRHVLREHLIFELPLNLKRNHLSYAHTESHVDQLVDATRHAIATARAHRQKVGAAASTMGGVELAS